MDAYDVVKQIRDGKIFSAIDFKVPVRFGRDWFLIFKMIFPLHPDCDRLLGAQLLKAMDAVDKVAQLMSHKMTMTGYRYGVHECVSFQKEERVVFRAESIC